MVGLREVSIPGCECLDAALGLGRSPLAMASRWPPRILGATRTARYAAGRQPEFALFRGTFRDVTERGGTPRVRLITRRSQVQILPPLLIRPDS